MRGLATGLAAAAAAAAVLPPGVAGAAAATTRYACNGEQFALAALRSPLGAQLGSSPAAAALRDLLRSDPRFDDGSRLPRMSWRVLLAEPDHVTFGSPLRRFGIYTVAARREGDRWRARPSSCTPARVGFAQFDLAEPLRRDARRIRVAIDVSGCGEPRKVRSVRTRIAATRRSVDVLLRVRLARRAPPPPGAVCPAIAHFRIVTIDLGRRLGDRALYDASLRPKRAVLEPRDR
jgi:hypothetical protein